MKRMATARREEPALTAAEVESYLREHPDFFADHLELLEILDVPHPSGAAVSLVMRQLDLLRAKNRRLQLQMDGLVQIARDNAALHQRIHQLTLTLLDANSVSDVLDCLDWGLHQYFQVDFVAVRLLGQSAEAGVANLFIPGGSPEAAWCEGLLEQAQPVCGPPDPDHAAFLFGPEAPAVASQALAILHHAGVRGVFAIGSRDAQRFRAEMGFEFLAQMSEILAARLSALLNQSGGSP